MAERYLGGSRSDPPAERADPPAAWRGRWREDRPLEERLQAELGPCLEEPEQPGVVGVDLAADARRRSRCRAASGCSRRRCRISLRLVRGPLLQDLQHVLHVALLVGQELLLGQQQVGDDLVGGGDHAALVGRGVAHDDHALLLQLHPRLRGDEGVGPLHDDPRRRGAVGQQEAAPSCRLSMVSGRPPPGMKRSACTVKGSSPNSRENSSMEIHSSCSPVGGAGHLAVAARAARPSGCRCGRA